MISPELPGSKDSAPRSRRSPTRLHCGRAIGTDLVSAGMEGVAFVGVPRTWPTARVPGVRAHRCPGALRRRPGSQSRGYLIPTRADEIGRFGFKRRQGATYGMTQLLYSDAIVGFCGSSPRADDARPEILLSFRLRAEAVVPRRTDQLAHPGSWQPRGRR